MAFLSDASQSESVTTKQHLKNHLMIKNRSQGSTTIVDSKQAEIPSVVTTSTDAGISLLTDTALAHKGPEPKTPRFQISGPQTSRPPTSRIQTSGSHALSSSKPYRIYILVDLRFF